MKLATRIAIVALTLLSISMALRAQQAAPPSVDLMTHLRVDLLLTEYSGAKKISSMPYMIYVAVGDTHYHPTGSLRMGVRVPVAIGTPTNYSTQLENVGTNIDVNATGAGDNLYRLQFTVGRTAVSFPDEGGKTGEQIHVGNSPIMRNFSSSFDLNLRDGESAEGMSATDPVSGNVVKASVTIHVVK
jgi:hypothetical protein